MNLLFCISSYKGVHVYLSLVVCSFGCIANSLNVVVLTRHEMRSPTNAILTGLAISDLLVMIDYIPYVLYDANLLVDGTGKYTKPWATYVLWHAYISQILHTISIFLTVILAIWRYIAVTFPHRNRVWCKMYTTIKAIIVAYILSFIISIPNYLSHDIYMWERYTYPNGTFISMRINATEDFVDQHNLTQFDYFAVGPSHLLDDKIILNVNLAMYTGKHYSDFQSFFKNPQLLIKIYLNNFPDIERTMETGIILRILFNFFQF